MGGKMNVQIGSLWRKWDLHVHSPASAGFKGTYETVVQQIKASDVDVIGVNDYFSIEGYKKLIAILPSDIEKTLLPVVEMRMNNVLASRHKEKPNIRINFHIIFNPYDEVNKSSLVESIESFIKSLGFKLESGKEALIGDIYNRHEEVLEKVTVDYFKVLEELEKNDKLSGQYLVWLPYDEYGGIDGIASKAFPFKPALINRADIIGSSNPKEIQYFLGDSDDYSKYFSMAKPCIKGSDSHDASYPLGKLKDNESKPINKYCWIKADPTFEGLKQIVREPEDRVFIGETPPKLDAVSKNRTKFIKRISIVPVDQPKTKDIWFDNSIEFNNGLIAIIGNKGKGKSALAEIVGLLGNTHNYEHFSFLNTNKFKKNKLASNYRAEITWLDSTKQSLNLMENPDINKAERCKCIPQNYLEILCNNLDKKFQEEIDLAIFSHIDQTEKIEGNSLGELIEYKTQIIDLKVQKIRDSIIKLNQEVIALEDRLKPEYLKQLEDKRVLLDKELRAHYSGKPPRKVDPLKDGAIEDKQKVIYSKLAGINSNIKEIEAKIRETQERLFEVNKRYEKLLYIKGKIEEIEQKYAEISIELSDSIKELVGIELTDVISFEINYDQINEKIKDIEKEKIRLELLLTNEEFPREELNGEFSYLYKLDANRAEARQLQELVDEPIKEFQIYIHDRAEWKRGFYEKNTSRREIIKQIAEVHDSFPGTLTGKKESRKQAILELFGLFKQKVEVYKKLHKPVIEFVNKERKKNAYMELDFSAEIMFTSDFDQAFLSYIDRGKKGSFQGIKESYELLKEIKQRYNPATPEGIIDLIDEINSRLSREEDGERIIERSIEDQMVLGKNKASLYAYLYLLRFIKIDYRLRWGDKLLEELSPGERGTVLLIFYLLIDNNDIPLIIDQPEENLDNESIYYLLVKYIKQAKQRRQLFIVTHNPNLAVVCDAEQVIYCDLDKKNRYRVTYTSGSIENIKIREKIVNVLEGTKPAFCNRKNKYEM